MNETDWLIMDAIKFEIERLKAENARLREALKEIANEDYRGNRPWSATVAWEALQFK